MLFLLFLFGLFFGSFFGVLIDRLPVGENPFKGRSRCDRCKHTLSPLDLIPVISFVTLGGHCRYCKKKLSIKYPLFELATASIFVLTYVYVQHMQITPTALPDSLLAHWMMVGSLIVVFSVFFMIFVTDFRTQLIPDELVVAAGGGALVFIWLTGQSVVYNILSGIVASLGLLTIFLVTKGRGMGLGDVKLAVSLGLLLGPVGTVIGLYMAFLTGALVSIILVFRGTKSFKSKIAFGPFLIIGTLISFFWGNRLYSWFTQLFV